MEYTSLISGEPLIEIARQAARLAGKEIKKFRQDNNFCIQTKSSRHDFLTDADLKADSVITQTINQHFPSHQLLSEERNPFKQQIDFNKPLWIVDPLDGTKNFIYGQHYVGVSIAFMDRLQLQAAVVEFPFINEVFHAVRGQGAFLNENRIQADNSLDLIDSILSSPFSSTNKDRFEDQVNRYRALYFSTADTRRTGCTSYDLCSVACGRLGGYFVDSIYPWDIAAGTLIVNEAGGSCGSYQDLPVSNTNLYFSKKFKQELPVDIYGESYYACSQRIKADLLKVLRS